jgi:hypothetical protein
MKLTTGCVIAVLLLSASLASADGRKFDGAPIQSGAVSLHIGGKPVTAQLIVASLHMMNQRGFQPTGLWEYFYILPDAATGNANVCERWFNQVRSDESQQTSTSATLAWLEIQLSDQAKPVETDEGYSLIPDAGINCWEALDFKPDDQVPSPPDPAGKNP